MQRDDAYFSKTKKITKVIFSGLSSRRGSERLFSRASDCSFSSAVRPSRKVFLAARECARNGVRKGVRDATGRCPRAATTELTPTESKPRSRGLTRQRCNGTLPRAVRGIPCGGTRAATTKLTPTECKPRSRGLTRQGCNGTLLISGPWLPAPGRSPPPSGR